METFVASTQLSNYYRDFLCPLFFKGFAEKRKTPETIALLGHVPYLNGGLFLEHQLEAANRDQIAIADTAFERVSDFFKKWDWHLDDRAPKEESDPNKKEVLGEINPDVLGYIFEKYINQKQMGAYYTKEDITDYIGKNTIIPFLFDRAAEKCAVAFAPNGSVWQLPRLDPDEYIYEAVKKGAELALPAAIAAGLTDVNRRDKWNTPTPTEYALPTEIWRETVARRQRYADVRDKLTNGQVTSINDFITYNLDIRKLAEDVIRECEGPELLRAFYQAIEKVTVLDPTCGSGAFLFAAMNILEPLYEACLDKMQEFVDDEREKEKRTGQASRRYKDFERILERAAEHPNRQYFIYKSIVVNNLYGVDIMEEAVEIAKLRLFLKLVAQIEPDERKPNLGIEPLPDIDFNIRAGNTLVGYATYAQAERAVGATLDFGNAMSKIKTKAEDVARLFKRFREQQTEFGGEVTPADKLALRRRLSALEEELNVHLAWEYGLKTYGDLGGNTRLFATENMIQQKTPAYAQWLDSHKPFHWFIEFYVLVNDL